MSANKVVVVGPPSASTTTATPVPAGSTGMAAAALSALHQQQSQSSQPVIESVKKMDKKNLNDLDLQVKGKFYQLFFKCPKFLFLKIDTG